jgi:NTE family protein
MRNAISLLTLTVCAACATTTASAPPPTAAPTPPPTGSTAAVVVPEPKIGLALGGGAARGFAHIGVIRVLEQERIPIDMVVGTSVGSLIGAIYAADKDSFDLEWTAFQLTQDDLFDFRLLNTVVGMGYAKGEKLETWVTEKVKARNIEQLKIPFAAVATDLNWGGRVVMDKGPVAKAVHASSAIPGIFEPVNHYGKVLVDGGVVDNLPGDVARERGADVVIAVDISEEVGNTNIKNLVDVLLQTTNIMCAESVGHLRGSADVLISPKVGGVGMLDFTKKKQTMQAGIDAARAAMPKIRAAIEAWKAKKAATMQPRT